VPRAGEKKVIWKNHFTSIWEVSIVTSESVEIGLDELVGVPSSAGADICEVGRLTEAEEYREDHSN